MDKPRKPYAHLLVEVADAFIPEDIGLIVISFEPTDEKGATANIAGNIPEEQIAELLDQVAARYRDGVRVAAGDG